MSRSRILSVTAALALAAVPAVAAAHGGSHHESDDHGGTHHRHGHHHHAHHRFSATFSGTVSSFTGGVLTLTLANGTTRSAKVTARTVIRCHAAAATARAARHGGDDPSGDDRRGSGSGNSGSGSRGRDAGDDDHGDDGARHDAGDDHGTDRHTNAGAVCDSSVLVNGVAVRHAVRHGSGATAIWRKLVVIR